MRVSGTVNLLGVCASVSHSVNEPLHSNESERNSTFTWCLRICLSHGVNEPLHSNESERNGKFARCLCICLSQCE